MGTKNNPGQYDAYAHAEPDEPIFVLIGRDPFASIVIRLWIVLGEEFGTVSSEKLQSARDVANAMEAYVLSQASQDGGVRQYTYVRDLIMRMRTLFNQYI